ncbi:hypothetical protein EDB80DRAFT_685189 [Ilyonectria destructans]|nr:hypothetical protein EDB80DRAFT_685189 [Ilyonectria destructans]
MSRPWRGAEARARHCSGGRRPTIVIGVAAVVVNGLACQRRAIEARKRASSGAAVEKRERRLEEVKDAASVEATEAQAKISPSPSPSQPATAACDPALLLGLLLLGLLLEYQTRATGQARDPSSKHSPIDWSSSGMPLCLPLVLCGAHEETARDWVPEHGTRRASAARDAIRYSNQGPRFVSSGVDAPSHRSSQFNHPKPRSFVHPSVLIWPPAVFSDLHLSQLTGPDLSCFHTSNLGPSTTMQCTMYNWSTLSAASNELTCGSWGCIRTGLAGFDSQSNRDLRPPDSPRRLQSALRCPTRPRPAIQASQIGHHQNGPKIRPRIRPVQRGVTRNDAGAPIGSLATDVGCLGHRLLPGAERLKITGSRLANQATKAVDLSHLGAALSTGSSRGSAGEPQVLYFSVARPFVDHVAVDAVTSGKQSHRHHDDPECCGNCG